MKTSARVGLGLGGVVVLAWVALYGTDPVARFRAAHPGVPLKPCDVGAWQWLDSRFAAKLGPAPLCAPPENTCHREGGVDSGDVCNVTRTAVSHEGEAQLRGRYHMYLHRLADVKLVLSYGLLSVPAAGGFHEADYTSQAHLSSHELVRGDGP